jgi:hypothetical protein
MTRDEWFTSEEAYKELRRLIDTTLLGSALEVLQQEARLGPLTSLEPTTLALQHAVASGYQKALDDLDTLAKPHITRKPKLLPKHWETKPEIKPL